MSKQKKLVELYAKLLAAQRGAGVGVEDRMRKTFYSYLEKMQAQYSEIDFESHVFWDNIKRAANKHMAKHPMLPGIAW